MSGPRCPNHGVELVDLDIPSGMGICPVSNARFSFDAQHAEKTKKKYINALGLMEEKSDWQVKNIDGKDTVQW